MAKKTSRKEVYLHSTLPRVLIISFDAEGLIDHYFLTLRTIEALDYTLDSFLKLFRRKPRFDHTTQTHSEEVLPLLENGGHELFVRFDTLVNIHLKSTKHDGNETIASG